MEMNLEEIEINGKKYYSKKQGEYKETDYKVVRTYAAGVFYGVIEVRSDLLSGLSVVLRDARRLWYWDGAASLSQLANEGVKKPQNCKFPAKVERVELMNVVEILDLSPAAKKNLDEVVLWKQ